MAQSVPKPRWQAAGRQSFDVEGEIGPFNLCWFGDRLVTTGRFLEGVRMMSPKKDGSGYELTWKIDGSECGDKVPFSTPCGMCKMGDTLFVCDAGNNRLVKLGMSGSCEGYIKLAGKPEDAAGNITPGPSCMYLVGGGEEGDTYIKEMVDEAVTVTHPLTYPVDDEDGLRDPRYIAYFDGFLVVTDYFHEFVYIYQTTGEGGIKLIKSMGKDEGVFNPRGVTWDPRDGALVVTSAKEVMVFDCKNWKLLERMEIEGADDLGLEEIQLSESGHLGVVDCYNSKLLVYPPS